MDQFVRQGQIGKGEFAKVTKIISRIDGKAYAIKEFSKNKDPVKIEKEIRIHSKMNHPNIIKLYAIIKDFDYNNNNNTQKKMILEIAEGGELFDYVESRGILENQEIKRLMKELLESISYLHNQCQIAHRDIKLENILLTKDGQLKLTDFGFASSISVGRDGDGDVLSSTACGSPCYAAPELVINTEKYCSRTADMWSCGVVMFAMSFGYLPFEWDVIDSIAGQGHHWSPSNIYKLYKHINALTEITLPPSKSESSLSSDGRDLLVSLLQPNPSKRATLKHALGHRYFL